MEELPGEVLEAWSLSGARVERVSVGLINRTFRVESGERVVCLQRLHPVFAPEVNLDIEVITEHLAGRGLLTPRLVRTTDGRASIDHEGVWRALTWVEGRVVERVTSPELARHAGAHVARFHRALTDLDHTFRFTRPGAHDTNAHVERLAQALRDHRGHEAIDLVRPIAERILAHAPRLRTTAWLPRRIVHGDLKISNVLFDAELSSAIALVDLDTMAHETIAIDLGDALRSWCNPHGEEAEGSVDVDVFTAAVSGYASEGTLTRAELRAIVPSFERMAFEVATRFCADALEERYFAWDALRYTTRSEHNRVRASSQLALALDVAKRRADLERIVDEAFSR